MSAPVFEFEVDCEASLVETWRVVMPEAASMSEEEIAETIDASLDQAGWDFVTQEVGNERDREVRAESIRRVEEHFEQAGATV